MSNHEIATPAHQAAVNGLAVVGFIALTALGISLAVYSARYVPVTVGKIGTAAVAFSHTLTSVFTPAPKSTLSVVPVASTTISFGEATTTPTSSSSTETVPKPVATSVAQQVAGAQTTHTYQIGSTTPSQVPYGFPDLIVTIKEVGFLATTSAESFVASSTVLAGSRPAVTFTIKNVGTAVSGPWRFSASIPTETAYIYQSQPQPALNPGDSIDYTLGFDQANAGSNKTISITANFDHAVTESNANNNSASTKITILGT